MIVSRVPTATLFRLPPAPRLFRYLLALCSSSELTACRVGPEARCWCFDEADVTKAVPEPWGAIWTSYWLLKEYRDLAHISAMRSRSALSVLSSPWSSRPAIMLLKLYASIGGSLAGASKSCRPPPFFAFALAILSRLFSWPPNGVRNAIMRRTEATGPLVTDDPLV